LGVGLSLLDKLKEHGPIDPFESQEVSSRYVRTVRDWVVKKKSPEDGKAFDRRLAEFLTNYEMLFHMLEDKTDNGVGSFVDEAVLIAAAEIGRDMLELESDDFYLRIGRRTIYDGLQDSTTFALLMAKMASMPRFLREIASLNSNFNSVTMMDYDINRSTLGMSVITRITLPHQIEKYAQLFGAEGTQQVLRNNCNTTQGMLVAGPAVVKKRDAEIVHPYCETTDGRCEYHLKWQYTTWDSIKHWFRTMTKRSKASLAAQSLDYDRLCLRLEQQKAEHSRDVHEKEKIKRQLLEEQKRELEAKNDALLTLAILGEMSGNIAHDMGNLLTLSTGPLQYIQMIVQSHPGIDDDAKSKLMEHSEDALSRGLGLVDYVQELTRIASTGQMTMGYQEMSVTDVTEKLVNTYSARARKKKIKLITSHLYDGTVFLDKAKIQMPLGNLVKNAIEAVGEDSVVQITTYEDDGHCVFAISDTGPGINPEIEPKLYECGATYGKEKGNGLGLNGSRKVVELHNGTLTHSTKLGEGTTFYVKIPILDTEQARDIVQKQVT